MDILGKQDSIAVQNTGRRMPRANKPSGIVTRPMLL